MRPSIPKLILLACLLAALPLTLPSCFTNDPYRPEDASRNIFYDTFSEEPKYLDPARSYSSDEYRILQQIYEAPLQYHYLKRPYELIPLTVEQVPEPAYYDQDGKPLPPDAPPDAVAKAVYELTIKPGIRFQEHACFATNPDGGYRWHLGPDTKFPAIDHPNELGEIGSRELRAEDYAYQIKRLANPLVQCPIFSLLAKYIDGFDAYADRLKAEIEKIRARRREQAGAFYNREKDEEKNPLYLDLRAFDFPGVEVVGERTLRIILKKKYPQFKYWLAMPFFAPMPWEAERFYSQAGLARQAITFNRFPVGTGPFVLSFSQPNWRIILERNANFAGRETYPTAGMPEDRAAGLLADAGQPLPFLEQLVFVLEKENIPEWNKFLQGYYDTSAIVSDVFDQAIAFKDEGPELTERLAGKGIRLNAAPQPTTFYFAFNMLDDVVGGLHEKNKKLRQAISIAVNVEELIQIFSNGRGIPAQGPIPLGITGYQEGPAGVNPLVYEWDARRRTPRRKGLDIAKKLLAAAGYPNGVGPDGKPLVLFFDTVDGGAGSKAYFDWLRKQFRALGIELQVRPTDYSTFRNKVNQGNWQILRWGWHADYPDPENFLFLLYGPNGKVKAQQENAANYENPAYDRLFEKMENMDDSPERLAIIKKMLAIFREDTPWFGAFHYVGFGLYHEWYRNAKPMTISYGTMKYKRIDIELRARRRAAWNAPVTWPLWLLFLLFVAGTIPATVVMIRRERRAPSA